MPLIKVTDYFSDGKEYIVELPYCRLFVVLFKALQQASEGKGKERHAEENENFEDQVICEIGKRLGIGYNLGQAVKKTYEVKNIDDVDAKINELLGAINYIASAIILLEEEREDMNDLLK